MSRPLVGLFAILVVVASAPAAQAQLQNALGNCKYYTKTQQDFEQGLPYCEQCIKDSPEDPEARFYGAWCLAELGRFEEAWPSYKWLIERKDDKDKKIKKFSQMAERDVQRFFGIHFNKGVEFLNANDFTSAKKEFLAATQIAPNKPQGFLNLGYAAKQTGDLDGALQAFRTAVEASAKEQALLDKSYEYLSLALGAKRDAVLAEANPDTAQVARITAELKTTLEHVVATNPSSDAALLQLGDIALAEGREQEGIDYVEKAIAISPDNVVKLYNIAVGFYQRNEHVKAASAFSLVAQHVGDAEDPLWRDAMYNQALSLKESGKYQEALDVALKLIETNDQEPDYHSLASGIYVELKNLPKAAEHAEKAESLKAAKVEGGEAP